MSPPILRVSIAGEQDIVTLRERSRKIGAELGFEPTDQTRLATAVSEIARNAVRYGGGGSADFTLKEGSPPTLAIRIVDHGPGIERLDDVLEGRYRSPGGAGLGIVAARRLMDRFEIRSRRDEGTVVVLEKFLPPRVRVPAPERLATIAGKLSDETSGSPVEEVHHQNRELLSALDELRIRQAELERLNRELEDTNRGVVALYAELDERADRLRRADEVKSKFLSNVSHEFRTPVNSILALSRLLLEKTDGELTPEQETQVAYIQNAAQELLELVNDLLDLAKVEAGRIEVEPGPFEIRDLFGALRGMMRPLLSESVRLVIEEPREFPRLHTDETKLSQILRNFLSNALKFTERGEVRVTATLRDGGTSVTFWVTDTGIGIRPEDQEAIFLEFTQVPGTLQKKSKGTGLGLPLCKKLAELLGGSVSLESEPGKGSTFSVTIPLAYRPREPEPEPRPVEKPGVVPEPLAVLVLDDRGGAPALARQVESAGFEPLVCHTVADVKRTLARRVPRAVVVGSRAGPFGAIDEVAALLRGTERTRKIPVLVSRPPEGNGADGRPDLPGRPVDEAEIPSLLRALLGPAPEEKLLVIDDDAMVRYVVRQVFAGSLTVVEAPDGEEGIRRAEELSPRVIVLDLMMPGLSGFDTLDHLKADPRTRSIPVVVITSLSLDEADKRRIEGSASAILPKDAVSEGALLATIRRVLAEPLPHGHSDG